MDRISKALEKLTPKERKAIKEILIQIEKGRLQNLDIKKLKIKNNVFRVRKGSLRIIFYKLNSSTRVLTIERRVSKTYQKR